MYHRVVESMTYEIVDTDALLLSLNSVLDTDAMLLTLHWNIEMIEMLCFLSYTVVVSVVDEIVHIVSMLLSLNSVLHLFHGDQIDIELAPFFHHAVLVLVEKIEFGLNLCLLFSYFDDFLFYCLAIVDKID